MTNIYHAVIWCVEALLAIVKVVMKKNIVMVKVVELNLDLQTDECFHITFLPLLKLIIQIQMFLCFECQF